jgi:hypothetical protein
MPCVFERKGADPMVKSEPVEWSIRSGSNAGCDGCRLATVNSRTRSYRLAPISLPAACDVDVLFRGCGKANYLSRSCLHSSLDLTQKLANVSSSGSENAWTNAALQHALKEEVDQTRYQDAFGNYWSGEGSKKERETAQSAPSASAPNYSHRTGRRV